MAITEDARDHLFETLRQQYGEDDARTLITMLSSHDPDAVATRAQLDASVERLDASIAAVDRKLDASVERLDASVERLDASIAAVDRKLDASVERLDASIAAVDRKLDASVERLDAEIGHLRLEMRQGFADVRAELKDAIADQTRTFTTWMFALLSVYTLMAGSFVALGTFIVAS
jgi:prefoldin subunit 5